MYCWDSYDREPYGIYLVWADYEGTVVIINDNERVNEPTANLPLNWAWLDTHQPE